ncbi:MAG: hypothetical protein QXV17_04665 [Candidatus Micrarchaeaceae archaeon]
MSQIIRDVRIRKYGSTFYLPVPATVARRLKLENKEGFRIILDGDNIVFKRLHEKGEP